MALREEELSFLAWLQFTLTTSSPGLRAPTLSDRKTGKMQVGMFC